ncbi:MAG TPA: HlyD family efflux transporter periplasmic adaptor subunit [Candidatus Limnocylindria bacterium]|nr:HlyD family efflux transporter periplasmic adaptor subunit [Candidatus Limnocylindria bacterium]
MNRRRNLAILAACLVAIVGIGVAVRPHAHAIPARTAQVAYTRFQTKLPETGVVQRPQTNVLAALVVGNLARIDVRPGEHVAAGTVLATIANPQLVNAEQDAHQAYLAAQGRARTAIATNAALPAQNRSAVVQAQAALEQARFNLNQAIQDERAGAQSGLGYGGTSAAQQRAAADAEVASKQTDLGEAQRIADANRALYAQKAISRDTLDQSVAKLDEARIAYDQSRSNRQETYAQLARQSPVLSDRVRAARDAVTQAQAQLASARAAAAEDHSGDVEAALADARQHEADWRYAADQVGRLRIVAPFPGTVQSIASETQDTLRPLQPGDPVTVGQAVVTLAVEGGFVVRARVDEQDVASVHGGQQAIVSGEDLGSTTLIGHVATIGAIAQKSDDPSNTARQVITTIALDRSVPYLRDGMNVDVDIVTQDQPHVLAVAADAIRRDPNGNAYVLVVRDGVAHRRDVRLGMTSDTQAVVRGGLRAGETIVVDRNVGIVDGVAVTPTAVPSALPSSQP